MAEITASMLKQLREMTGVGMNTCKEALVASGGNIEEAVTYLRKKGLSSAAKKADRVTNEGMIASAETPTAVALVEVNAETDFVVKNDRFQEFLRNVAEEAAKTTPASLEAFLSQKYSKDSGMTIDEYRATVIQAIGENIQIRRVQILPKSSSKSIGVYTHLGGKLVVTVELDGTNGEEALAKDIAMHIAAASPDFLSVEKIPKDVLEHEKEIIRSQIPGNKPAEMLEKIIEGKLNAYYKERCLTNQLYIRDDSKTIAALVEEHAKKSGKPLAINGFIRWSVGQ